MYRSSRSLIDVNTSTYQRSRKTARRIMPVPSYGITTTLTYNDCTDYSRFNVVSLTVRILSLFHSLTPPTRSRIYIGCLSACQRHYSTRHLAIANRSRTASLTVLPIEHDSRNNCSHMTSDRCTWLHTLYTGIRCIYYKTVYSTWNDVQRSLEAVSSFVRLPRQSTFYQRLEK